MPKSYIPPKLTTLFVMLAIFLWLFNFYNSFLVLILLYLFIYVVLRRDRNDFLDDPMVTKGVIFSPVNGKIMSVVRNVSHGSFGENLIEIQIMIPWWEEQGIYLPLSSEVKNVRIMKGNSIWRYRKIDETLGAQDGKGVNLSLDNKEELVGLSFFKCKLGLWPELMVVPGDRGSRRVNIGYFPFGGTVVVYLPKKYEILLEINDEVTSGESILAVIPEHDKA